MDAVAAVIISVVGFTGGWLYLGLVAENKRTRPARVRQQLIERFRQAGYSEDRIANVIAHLDDDPQPDGGR